MATDSRNRQMFGDDWLDRQIIPDVYPRKRDPYSSGGYLQPPTGTPIAGPDYGPSLGDIFKDAITQPGVRPVAYQRALNASLTVIDTAATPLQTGTFQCDAFLISVPSSSVNSTFFGFGSGVTSSSGIEVKPGIPQFYSPDNVREQWEIQRLLESINAMLGVYVGQALGVGTIPPLGPFMSPRVVLNAHDYYVINAAGITQTVAVMLFTVPEYQ